MGRRASNSSATRGSPPVISLFLASSLGIDTEGLVKTEEQKQLEQQAAQAQQTAMMNQQMMMNCFKKLKELKRNPVEEAKLQHSIILVET